MMRVVVWTLAGVALALLVLLLLSFVLKRQVMRVTADLRTSRDELNTILDSVGAHVYIKDTELRYQYANKPTQELWGKSLADIKGQKDDAFFDQVTAQKIAENDQWVLTNGERLVTEELNNLRRQKGLTKSDLLSTEDMRNFRNQTRELREQLDHVRSLSLTRG